MDAAALWTDLGVRNVIVTNGVKTIAYSNKNGDQKVYDITPSDKVVDVTGAGDSFSSAIIVGWLKRYSVDDIVKMAMANSRKTIETPFIVRVDLSTRQLIIVLKE